MWVVNNDPLFKLATSSGFNQRQLRKVNTMKRTGRRVKVNRPIQNGKNGHSVFHLERAEDTRHQQNVRPFDEFAVQIPEPPTLTLAEELLALFLDGNSDTASANMDPRSI
jgi:hypothetical protein